jgi:Asp-tRNA(Asn)/Glu-tRNA(Gln) amidotransferase A subunit family amidase
MHKCATGIAMTLLALVFSASAAHAEIFRLEEATIADITAAFNAGALTCRQLTQLYLNRIAAYDKEGPKLNSIITVNPRALETAAALDEERRTRGPRGRLHCIPVLLKDNIDTADMPTSNGSVILKDAIPPDDAYITKALKNAGALILGKAAMGEFAAGSYNSVIGQTINPYNVLRDTGGSSSGSGASIAANFAVLAVGTDTSTSVRGPASFNGIVGIRPTTGLVSRDGIAPKNLNFDSAGPLARTVTDVAIMLTTMAGPDPADPDGLSADVFRKHPAGVGMDYTQFLRRGSLKGARIGVARAYFGGDPEIDALANAAIARMKELGAEIIDPVIVDPGIVDNVRNIADYRFKDDWEKYLATFGPQVPKTVAEFLNIYKTKVAQSPLPAADSTVNLLERALKTSTDLPEYNDLMKRVLPANTAMKNAIFDRYNLDALVFPYNPTFATPINNPVYKRADPTFVASTVPAPSTLATYSSIGSPGIVVPMGFGKQGLPMTISFMGRPYEEGKIIGYAYDYEQATKLRRPSRLVPPLAGETITYELR